MPQQRTTRQIKNAECERNSLHQRREIHFIIQYQMDSSDNRYTSNFIKTVQVKLMKLMGEDMF